MTSGRLVLLLAAILGSVAGGFCQITTVTADQAPPVKGAGHDYIKLMNETVVPASGAVNLHIDVGVPPGRDITLPFAVGYDSNSARHFTDGSPVIHDNGGYLAQGGWRFVVPQMQALLNPSQILGDPSSQSATYEVALGLWPKGIPTPGMSVVGGFAQGINGTFCNAFDSYTFTDPDGTLHPLGINLSPSRFQGCNLMGFAPDLLQNTDGVIIGTTSATAQLNIGNNPVPAPVTVFDHDGTVFSFSNALGRLHGPGAYFNTNTTHDGTTISTIPAGSVNYKSTLPDFIETRNGNQIIFTDNDSSFNATGSFQITDTLGRPAVKASSFGSPSGDTITVSGFSQPYTLSWGTVSYNWTYNAHIVAPSLLPTPYYGCATPSGNNTSSIRTASTLDAQGTVIGSSTVVTSIQLPNGLSYQFLYDNPNNENPYGLLRKIIYPNGAYVRYVWGLNLQSTSVLYPPTVFGTAPGALPRGWSCEAILDPPAIQKRFVSFDGVHEVQEQDFQYSTSWIFTQNPSQGAFQAWSQKTTTVTTHDNATNTSFRTVYTFVPQADLVLGNDPQSQLAGASGVPQTHPVEKTIQYFDTNGSLRRTITKAYSLEYLPPDVLTTLDNGQSSYLHNVFTPSTNVVTDVFTYDFGTQADSSAPGPHGPLLSHVHADYGHAFPLNPLMPAVTTTTPYNTAIIDRPSDVITYDAGGNRAAEIDYCYDGDTTSFTACGASSLASASATGHDDQNFSTSFVSGRGNATTKIARCFTGTSQTACPQGDSVTTYAYDQTGQQVSRKDPKGNTTIYSFTDSFFDPTPPSNATNPPGNTNAYLTKITYPSTNGISHIESFSYAYSDGALTVLTDENGNQTKHKYNDSLRRLTETDFPDTGQTTVTYNDSGSNPTVVTNEKIDSIHTLTTTLVADGLGHPVQTQINSDPSGVDFVDTGYDGLGRVISSSNPHRSASALTDGVTQTQYDALSRPTRMTKQDGSVSTVSYPANCSVAIDEAGKRRRSCSDALGRLIEVDEPTPGVSESIQATNASANVALSGSLQSKPSSNHATGTVTIVGTDSIVPGTSAYDFGTVMVTVGTASVTVNYGNFGASPSSASDVASALCSAINSTSSTSSQVSCSPNGAVMNLTAQAAGTGGNGITLAVQAQTQFPQSTQSAFSGSFTSGSLSGGGALIYDSGTTTITISGRGYNVSWFGSATTASSIASSLASAINNDPGAFATASALNGTVSVFANVLGMSGNGIPLACSSSYDSGNFSVPSFTISCPSTLSGGHEAGSLSAPMVTLYNYDALGDLLQVTQQGGTTDQTQWRTRLFTYDSLGGLLTANNPESGTLTYNYDANGNVVTKTDARGVIVNYSPPESPIDPLDRVTKITYSDGTTPAVFFVYDTASNWGNPAVTQSNLVGRLSLIYETGTTTTGNQVFGYDAMGRVVVNNQCTPSNCGTGNYPLSAAYDLAGNLTSLTHPSGRLVTYSYNAGNLLDQVQFKTWNGTAPSGGAFNYWVASDTNFHPNGVPKSWTFGNGVTESTTLNNRLQLQEETVSNPAIYTFADHIYNYGTQNNGNILSVTDQLNSSRTQSFTYDALNRLSTANEGRWGLGFVYDAWGNRLQQNVTAGVAGGIQITVDNKNHIQGAPSGCTAVTRYCYDAAGNLLHDNLDHQYVYDAENRIKQVDSGVAIYTYTAEGSRVRKDVSGSPGTEYLYFNGNVIAERNVSTGDWTDYVWANGKRIAKAIALDNGLRIYGTRCGSCGTQYSLFYLSVGGLVGYTIRSGDKLDLTQYQLSGSHGGIVLVFSDGTNTNWNLRDQDTYFANDDGTQNTTHVRKMDLGSFVGKIIQQIALNQESDTAAGSFAIIYEQAVLTSSDGTVQPVYTGESTSPVSSIFSTSGVTGTASHIDVNEGKGIYPTTTTTYYHTNQINSSTLVTAGSGWPVWQATYLPYGEEYNPQIGTETYKFTGKERDSETGLDYFGARYYGSSLGRFVTSDPLLSSGHPANPQGWNRYAYVLNNPIKLTDPTGFYEWEKKCKSSDQKCQRNRQKFRDALQKLREAAKKFKEGSDKRKALDKILAKIGTEGDGNNIRVGFDSNMSDPGWTSPQLKFGFIPTGNILMKFNFDSVDNDIAKAGYDQETVDIWNAGLVGHEGNHAAEGNAASAKWLFSRKERLEWERRGINIESLVFEGFNKYEPTGPLWNPSWAEADRETLRKAAVDNMVREFYEKKKKPQ